MTHERPAVLLLTATSFLNFAYFSAGLAEKVHFPKGNSPARIPPRPSVQAGKPSRNTRKKPGSAFRLALSQEKVRLSSFRLSGFPAAAVTQSHSETGH